jgi:hypothetical protein
MGLFKKIGKTFHKAVKSAGKVAGKVFKSNILKVATSALSFVPGLNAVGLIGKGLSVLGDASSIQKWMKGGLGLFQKLTSARGLTQSVKSLFSGKFQPLGALSKLTSGIAPAKLIRQFVQTLKPRLDIFQSGFQLAKQFSNKLAVPSQFLPPGWQELSRNLAKLPGTNPAFLRAMTSFPERMHGVAGMLQELLKTIETPTSKTGPIIRA